MFINILSKFSIVSSICLTLTSCGSSSQSSLATKTLEVQGSPASTLFAALKDAGAEFRRYPGAAVVQANYISCLTTALTGRVAYTCDLAGKPSIKDVKAKNLFDALRAAGAQGQKVGVEHGGLKVASVDCSSTILRGEVYSCNISQ